MSSSSSSRVEQEADRVLSGIRAIPKTPKIKNRDRKFVKQGRASGEVALDSLQLSQHGQDQVDLDSRISSRFFFFFFFLV